MSAEPVITVVTPVLNGARFIGRAVESVRRAAELGANVEHLILDGGSADGTAEIARRAAAEPVSPIVRVISERDSGQSGAINRGLALARGKYFGWLNADDYYLPAGLAEISRRLAASDAGAVVGRCRFVDGAGRSVFVPSPPDPVGTGPLLRLLSGWFAGRSIVQPEAFVRTDVLRRLGGLREKLHYTMDYELWLRLCAAGKRFELTGVDVARQVVHARQKTHDNAAVVREMLGYVPGFLGAMAAGPERVAAVEEIGLVRRRLERRDWACRALEQIRERSAGDAIVLRTGARVPERALREVGRLVLGPRRVLAAGLGGEDLSSIRRVLCTGSMPAISADVPGVVGAFDAAIVGEGAIGRGSAVRDLGHLVRPGGVIVLVGAILGRDVVDGSRVHAKALGDSITASAAGVLDGRGWESLSASLERLVRESVGVSMSGCVLHSAYGMSDQDKVVFLGPPSSAELPGSLRPMCAMYLAT